MASLSKFGKIESARTHDEARAIVCCVCARKVKVNKKGGIVKTLSAKLSYLVQKFVFDGYSDRNSAYPTAMCGTCRLTLFDLEKVGKPSK